MPFCLPCNGKHKQMEAIRLGWETLAMKKKKKTLKYPNLIFNTLVFKFQMQWFLTVRADVSPVHAGNKYAL